MDPLSKLTDASGELMRLLIWQLTNLFKHVNLGFFFLSLIYIFIGSIAGIIQTCVTKVFSWMVIFYQSPDFDGI